MTRTDWDIVGFVGQGMFTARFVVQWMASEKKSESVVPTAFWWLSLAGGLVTLGYAIAIESRVFIVGQSFGMIVYIRNLMLVARRRRKDARARQRLAIHPPHLDIETRVAAAAQEG